NLGMPCRGLPKNVLFELSFHKRERLYRQSVNVDKKCIVFYVEPSGKQEGRTGNAPRQIVADENLRGRRKKLCIFAFESETIRETLCEDGRFQSNIHKKKWKLVLDRNKSYGDDLFVDDSFSSKSFVVEISNENVNQEALKSNDVATRQPESMQENDKIGDKSMPTEARAMATDLDSLREMQRKKEKKQGQTIMKLLKEDFGKQKSDATPVRLQKILVEISESVGYIQWNSNGYSGTATCFHLCSGYILTYRHVLELIVGKGVDKVEWPTIIQQSTQVNFHFENSCVAPDDKWFRIEPWADVIGENLDYVILKLKIDPPCGVPGLITRRSQPPLNGLVYIIGHPGGKEKSIDTCGVIPFASRQEEAKKRLSEGQRTDHNYIHLISHRDFVVLNSNVVTYDTNFFHGSSGSPALDSFGQLVAMHSAGFTFKLKGKENSMIEYGYSMRAILLDIEARFPEFYESVSLDVEMQEA
uniref:Serine protease n=1 Tax=Latimeria chalumnae TaxID=7897 RepID=H3A833_LATCH